jgi:phage-related protein
MLLLAFQQHAFKKKNKKSIQWIIRILFTLISRKNCRSFIVSHGGGHSLGTECPKTIRSVFTTAYSIMNLKSERHTLLLFQVDQAVEKRKWTLLY